MSDLKPPEEEKWSWNLQIGPKAAARKNFCGKSSTRFIPHQESIPMNGLNYATTGRTSSAESRWANTAASECSSSKAN